MKQRDKTGDKLPFDRSKVADLNEFARRADVGSAEFLRLFHGAREFIVSKSWVKRVEQIFVGQICRNRAGVFLFKIVPTGTGIDRFHWVIWGDVPPAYLVLDHAKDPQAAVQIYRKEVARWIQDVRTGRRQPETMPVDWPETAESAEELERLLNEVFGSES